MKKKCELRYSTQIVNFVVLFSLLSVMSVFFVGWEFQMYTTSEAMESVEICLVVLFRQDIILLTPAVFEYQFISTGEAIGTVLYTIDPIYELTNSGSNHQNSVPPFLPLK